MQVQPKRHDLPADKAAVDEAAFTRVCELDSWLRRAKVRAAIVGAEHAAALAEAQRIEAELIVAARAITGGTIQ
jgi:hypothetical protein